MRLLISGFEPFGGERLNPSWEAVRQLPNRVGAWDLTQIQIPTVFGQGAARLLDAAAEVQPSAILCVGQAGGRGAVTPEVIGINLREASIADNAGQKPENEPVVPGGPAAYFATLPVRDMASAIRRIGLPATLSYSAGTFVCNDVLYTLLHYYHQTETRVGFIHVPFLPEQAKGDQPSMPLKQMIQALQKAIEVIAGV